jgi:hypothetical protein
MLHSPELEEMRERNKKLLESHPLRWSFGGILEKKSLDVGPFLSLSIQGPRELVL